MTINIDIKQKRKGKETKNVTEKNSISKTHFLYTLAKCNCEKQCEDQHKVAKYQ